MSIEKKKKISTQRRAARTRFKLQATGSLPRLSVFRSLNHIYAQLIDDVQRTTLVSYSSHEEKVAGDKKEVAKAVGKGLAQRALEKGVSAVVFDRGSYLYHGRIKALADAAREAGLKF